MGMIDSAWFHEQLARKGVSLRDLARFMELDPSAVSRMLTGERKMSADEQDEIAAFLGFSVNDVALHRRGLAEGFGEIKQEGYTAGPPAGSKGSSAKMFTEADIIYKDGKRWFEGPEGLLPLHPMFGCMKGTMTIPADLDLTAPADPDWGKVYDDE